LRKARAKEFEAFLRLVDEELSQDCTIIIVGGAAIGLAYAPDHATTDIDVMPTRQTALWKAVERAQAQSQVPIPFQAAGIVQPPYEYEERLRPLPIRGLKHLKVLVPEPHDLALMKVARGEAHDLAGIEDIHRVSPLSLDTLLARYEESRVQFIGNRADLRLGFLALVARLFGEREAEELETKLRK
jgi:hypothetical protein